MPTVRTVTAALDRLAPPGSKLDFDRVGLQVGDPEAEVTGVVVALDLTPAVLDEAEAAGAGIIVAHHPLLFKPLAHLTPTDFVPALAWRLARAGIAFYAIHTNLDVAHGGVSFALAEQLGLEDVTFLRPTREALVKVTVFVPESHAEAVREAMAEAGAGRIGDYEACAFALSGTGFFRPTEAADPYQGEAGRLERAPELRLEAEVPRWLLGAVQRAVREAHPYEEVAMDVVPLEQPHTRTGLGAIGSLPEAMPLSAFLRRTADRLGAEALRYTGDPEASVRRVAVCGGSGSSLLRDALSAGADAYVTADITYHTFFEPLAPDGTPRMALVDTGHYETERITESLLVDALASAFPDLAVSRTRTRTSPMRTYVP